ncbi:MAG: hypothetical protein R3B41_04150 [Candidatus Doudnabacteria bacterium]
MWIPIEDLVHDGIDPFEIDPINDFALPGLLKNVKYFAQESEISLLFEEIDSTCPGKDQLFGFLSVNFQFNRRLAVKSTINGPSYIENSPVLLSFEFNEEMIDGALDAVNTIVDNTQWYLDRGIYDNYNIYKMTNDLFLLTARFYLNQFD